MSELDQVILNSAKNAISESVVKALTGYDSPLNKLCKSVIDRHLGELDTLVDTAVTNLICGDSFKLAIKENLEQKLARTLIERMGGELESQVNKLKSNPETRARITLAISKIIKEL